MDDPDREEERGVDTLKFGYYVLWHFAGYAGQLGVAPEPTRNHLNQDAGRFVDNRLTFVWKIWGWSAAIFNYFAEYSGAQNLFHPVSGGSFLPRAPSLSKPSLKRLGFVVSGVCVVLIDVRSYRGPDCKRWKALFMVFENTVKASVRAASPKHHTGFKTINFGKQGFGKFFSGRVNHW